MNETMYSKRMHSVLTLICIVVLSITCVFGGIRVYEGLKKNKWDHISCYHGFTWNRCMFECVYVKMCKSFGHMAEGDICLLYAKTIAEEDRHLIADGTITWADVSEVPSEMLGDDTCAERRCGLYERCYPTEPYTCVTIDCGYPPMKGRLPTDMTVMPGSTHIGSHRPYYCHSIRDVIGVYYGVNDICTDSTQTVCMSNFQWSNNKPACYERSTIFDCKSIRECRRHYMDGEYWIYKKGMFDLPIKVYCHNMTGTPVMYLTLDPSKNFAEHTGDAGGAGQRTTYFYKVRVEHYDFSFIDHDTYKIITDDFTFAATTPSSGTGVTDMEVYSAGGCHTYPNTTKAFGAFSFDLTGTTFKLTGKNSWTTTTDGVLMSDYFEGNHSAHGSCWSAACVDGCHHLGELTIEVDKKHAVPQTSATKPICP